MPLPLFNKRQPGTKPNNWEMNVGEHHEAIVLACNAADGMAFFSELTKTRFEKAPSLDDTEIIEGTSAQSGERAFQPALVPSESCQGRHRWYCSEVPAARTSCKRSTAA